MTQLPRMFEVTDDSGFLGVVDPDAYATYVSGEWTLEQLFTHFRSQMGEQALLLWGTGMNRVWCVEVVDAEGSSRSSGFRRTVGPIRVTEGRLLLVSYETLTMAAQFADVTLPEPHCTDLLVDIPSGDYTCEITQLENPDIIRDDDDADELPDFVLTLTPARDLSPWTAPAWFALTG